MVVIGIIIGVVWVLLLVLVLAICRASGRADAYEERLGRRRPEVTIRPGAADRSPAPSAGGPALTEPLASSRSAVDPRRLTA